MISPLVIESAAARVAELRRMAPAPSRGSRPVSRRLRTRRRAGLWLVTVGLRVAGPVNVAR